MFCGMTAEEVAAGLDAIAMEVLGSARVQGPPVDPVRLAQALGLVVVLDGQQGVRGRYVRLRGPRGRMSRPTVLLRPDPRPERRHWALAHEIGEHVAHRVFQYLGIDLRLAVPQAREFVANQMAGRLLLPTVWFEADALATQWDLLALKARYATASHELIARRMLEFPSPAIITIFDQGAVTFRKSNVPGRVPPCSADEIGCWQEVHREHRPAEAILGSTRVRGWPVHEPGWKREILRTELACEPAWA